MLNIQLGWCPSHKLTLEKLVWASVVRRDTLNEQVKERKLGKIIKILKVSESVSISVSFSDNDKSTQNTVVSALIKRRKNSCEWETTFWLCCVRCPAAVWSNYKFHKDLLLASRAKPRHTTVGGRNHCSPLWNCRLDILSVISPVSFSTNIIEWSLWWPDKARWSYEQSMSSGENYNNYHDSNYNSCLSLNSVDIKRNPISSQLSGQDYIHFSAPGLKKSKRSKGKRERENDLERK